MEKMIQSIDIKNKDSIKVKESNNIEEIREVLNALLYVQNERLKPRLVKELSNYLNSKLIDEDYKLKVFIASSDSEYCGFVVSQFDPNYKSYSRKCGTFGWLTANDFEVCKKLIKECEIFLKGNRVRKLRGNVNFPKTFGGFGIQATGFEEQMIYGVTYGDPKSKILDYLDKLGYARESEYICMKVTKKTWDSGKRVSKDIRFEYLPLDELPEKKEEILNIAKGSFYTIMPDSTGGDERFDEMLETYAQVPASHYKIPDDFDPKKYSNVPEFVEAWKSCDLEKIMNWVPLAIDRKTGDIAGLILGIPDLYELWLDQPITRANVDTVMVKKEYAGKGIFSALNNIGQLTCNLNGITYYEGTTIWYNNPDAINAIFPHGEHIRKHYVVQKRI